MARVGVALVALGLLCLLPTSSACSWALPERLAKLEPAGDAFAVNGAHDTAGLLLPNGSYTPVVPIGPQTMAWAASPDARWFAYAAGAPVDEPQGGVHGYSTCWMPLGATEVVDLEHDVRARVRDGAAYALAFSGGSLAVATEDGLFVYAAGNWTDATRRELPFPAKEVRHLAWSGDGRVLVAATWTGKVAVAGGLLDPVPWSGDRPVAALAVDAEGGRLVVAVDGKVHTANVTTGRWMRDVDVGFPATALAWGAGGIAVVGGEPGEDGPPERTEVLLVPEGWSESLAPPEPFAADTAWVERRVTLEGRPGDAAWLADGRLGVGAGGRLVLLDEDLHATRVDVRALAAEPQYRAPDLDAERGPPRRPAPGAGLALVAIAALVAALRRSGAR